MRTVTVPVAHNLPKEEVRQRMQERIGGLGKHLPAGATVEPSWPSEDRMALAINAMGQNVNATLDVQDRAVLITVQLPGMLGMMGGMIEGMIQKQGPKLIGMNKDRDGDANPSG